MWSNVGGVRLYYLLTREGEYESKPGRTTLANLNHCLRRLRHELEKDEVTSLYHLKDESNNVWSGTVTKS